jgi:hypothetical protein
VTASRIRPLGAVGVLLCWFAIGAASPEIPLASAAQVRSCGSIRADGTSLTVTIEKGSVSCKTARTVLEAFFAGKGKFHGPPNGPAADQTWTLDGWSCGRGAGGGGCIRNGTNYRNAHKYIVAEVPS